MDATDIQHEHAVDEQPQIIVTREVERHRGIIDEFAFFRLHELRVCVMPKAYRAPLTECKPIRSLLLSALNGRNFGIHASVLSVHVADRSNPVPALFSAAYVVLESYA